MKKIVFFLLLSVSVFCFVSCQSDDTNDPIDTNIDPSTPVLPSTPSNEITSLTNYPYITQTINSFFTDLDNEVSTISSISSLKFIYTYFNQSGTIKEYIEYYVVYKVSSNNDNYYAKGTYMIQGTLNTTGIRLFDDQSAYAMSYSMQQSLSEGYVDYVGQTFSTIEEAESVEGTLAQLIIDQFWD
ncbi:MAG: hypothetical protein RBT45_02430 [Acholeplasmataceae bacterium]|jgi:hypothetical protein|nr:hypothetical protein [Acholeplasmataceae bacterium]